MSDPSPYPARLAIEPLTRPPRATVRVPGSKSITNRALVLSALAARGYECHLANFLDSEDTCVMVNALGDLGFHVSGEPGRGAVRVGDATISSSSPLIPASQANLFVGNSGTTMRFLTAVVCLGQGRYRLDGVPRMRERPIGDLLDALRQLGVRASSEAGNGCPPVVVESEGLPGGDVRLRGDVSSQFLSGLLLAAPFAQDEVRVEVEGVLVSEPYVAMTLAMLRDWGLTADTSSPGRYRVPGRQTPARRTHYAIEPDASAASYFFAAAAITGGAVTVPGLSRRSLQGDVGFVDVLEKMGCTADRGEAITVQGGPLRGVDVDMNAVSDTVMTLAAVACFAEGPTTIRNVAHVRHKETDRLAALAAELRKLGAAVEEFADGLTITPRPLRGAEVQTYDDHRMAMGLALLGLRVPGVVILNPACVAKTYPGYFADLERLRE
jgi:3-phosphoshikimate 1-carboxyvinyltransferase